MKPTRHGEVLVITADGDGFVARLGELWNSRDVLRLLVQRDLLVKYRQTLLGVAWAVLQPVMMMTLFGIFFGRLAKMPSDGVPYALFAFSGLLPWTFVANAVAESGASLVANPDLITKVYVPRPWIPIAAVVAGLVDFAIGLVVLFPLLAYFHHGVSLRFLAIIPLAAVMTLVASGVGCWVAALNVKYRDVRYALPFLIQLWLFATPVIYPMSIVPAAWRSLLLVNPMVGVVGGFRSAFLDLPFNATELLGSGLGTLVILVLSLQYFGRVERGFADVV